jgi:hypothetical protein
VTQLFGNLLRRIFDPSTNDGETFMAIIGKSQTKPQDDGIPAILDRRTNGAAKPDVEALLARIAQLEAQVAKGNGGITMKIGQSGGLSIYGLGNRYPTTLYKSQWEKLLAHTDDIKAFLEANADKLATKE